MKTLRKIIAGAFLTVGFFFLVLAVAEIFAPDSDRDTSLNIFLGSLMLGIPAVGIGGYMVIELRHEYRIAIARAGKDLESLLLEALVENRGKIAVVQFAIAAELTYDEAKEFLDRKALQLNANFEVDEEGRLLYDFQL
jgi:hypothetical protein